jgi:hypothetical protein
MARKRGDRIVQLITDVEKDAQDLRAAVREQVREARVLKRLQKAAERLRKRAATAAGYVEKYVHEIRTDLESRPAARARGGTSRATPKRKRAKRKARRAS